ncbi:MAG: hypothetical protein CMM76_03050 [Rhodospirillaceae bacterium]|nr:hypothetical protein [Rhodospirillaceae bacterium]
MRQSQGQKRSRNRGGNNRRGGGRQQSFDSNGPSVRIRGNATQIHEKYLTLARDASASGDRVAAENFSQHAEHYHRVIAAEAEQREQREQRNNTQNNNRNRNANGNSQNNAAANQGETAGEEAVVEIEPLPKSADKTEGNGKVEETDVDTVAVEAKPKPQPKEQELAAGD